MTIRIDDLSGLKKLLAFLAVGASGKFNLPDHLLPQLLEAVQDFARKKGIRVTVVDVTEERIVVCAAGGAIAGALAGMLIAGVPGAGAGLALGAVAGYACAHLTLTVSPKGVESTGELKVMLSPS